MAPTLDVLVLLEIIKMEISSVLLDLKNYRLGRGKKSYKKDVNEGLQNLCARPIPEKD